MTGPWEEYDKSPQAEGPWSEYAKPKKREYGKGAFRKVDSAVRGAADFLSFGFADEAEAAAAASPALLRGGAAFREEYGRRLADEHARDAADRAEVPVSRGIGEGAGFVMGLGSGAVVNIGRAVPRIAANAGRIARGAETVGRNVLAGAGFGGLAGAGQAEGGVENRLAGAGSGAAAGGVVGGLAAPVAAVAGRTVRGAQNILAEPVVRAVRRLGREAEASAPAMRARAAEFRAAGIAPTLTDAADEGGRGVVRAAATRMTPGRQVARDFAERRALDLPDRIGGQARRNMSADPRTPQQITDEVIQRRNTTANQQYGAVRAEPVAPTDDMVQALRTDHARDAIREAVRRERDPDVRAALNRLQASAMDDPASIEMTVGMADRISRVLNGRASAAARGGDNDLATTLGGLARGVRTPALANPGYAEAASNFAAESRMADAAGLGEDLLRRNTDEFTTAAQALTDDERALALATGRRAVERAAGESVSGAPGVARRLSTAPEQRARNAALMGDDAAAQFENGVALEERAVQNANDISPRSGSRTSINNQDAERLAGAAKAIGQVAQGDVVGFGIDWLRSRGMSDREAQALVDIATDPSRLDDAIRIIESRFGAAGTEDFVRAVTRQSGSRNAGENSVRRGADGTIEIDINQSTNPEFLASRPPR